ncbi:uncharacterized protein LOC110697559 isoform X3 [Chenopodium quinoa]|uniref:uncharacterized protein LOC110697559 isoform X3 n=1 Tax=Chenopodium quinoa TaxID=63459 RepID=UPI000B785E59|nr:uncharacterized protein LOC110697559 isoform X3 [Chenopodium quinoa]
MCVHLQQQQIRINFEPKIRNSRQNRGKDFQLVNYLTEQPKFLVIIRQNLSLVVLEDQLPEMSCKLKANRAIKLLKKRAMSKEKKISAAMAAGLDWGSDDSKDEVPVIIVHLKTSISPGEKFCFFCIELFITLFFGMGSATTTEGASIARSLQGRGAL